MQTFLIFTRTPWEEPERARHQVAKALTSYGNVLFIEANKVGFPNLKITKISENFSLVSTRWFVDHRLRFRLPIINELYQLWFLKKIQIHLKKFEQIEFINFDHTAHILMIDFRNSSIYYCNDDHIRSYRIPFLKSYFNFTEKRVAKNACLNVCTTDWLMNKINNYNQKTIKISLGAPSPVTKPIYIKTQNPINLLMVGFINESKVSIKTLEIILNTKNYVLTVVGPVASSMSKVLSQYNNYIEKGVEKGLHLEQSIKNANVCLALYNSNDENMGRSPNKLWQYLAFGKPVVVSNIPAVKKLNISTGLIYPVNSDEEIMNVIHKAASEDNLLLFEERIKLAKENSWDNKIKYLLKYINNRK